MAAVYETATFYHHFDVTNEKETPPPDITIRVCESVTCEMFGAKKLIKRIKISNRFGKQGSYSTCSLCWKMRSSTSCCCWNYIL